MKMAWNQANAPAPIPGIDQAVSGFTVYQAAGFCVLFGVGVYYLYGATSNNLEKWFYCFLFGIAGVLLITHV